MWHVWGREDVRTGFWWGRNLRNVDHLKDLDVEGRIIIKWFFKKLDGVAWSGLIWHRTGTVRGYLRMQ
jgi:hypothetical protein